MLSGDENLNYFWRMSGRGNGKCAMERELLRKAKIIKTLKKELTEMYNSAVKELNSCDKELDKAFINGYQDAVLTVMWLIYTGEHYEN